MRIAIAGLIVAQPNAGELAHCAIRPFDAQRLGTRADFHGGLASSKLGGDLFIQPASDDPGKNLLLTRRKGFEALFQPQDFRFTLAPVPVFLQARLNGI